jgi:Gly-Xaa carboxypeptidase
MVKTDSLSYSMKEVRLPILLIPTHHLIPSCTAAYAETQGIFIASPGITEKGLFNTRIEVTSPSGHSMNPPPYTSIGYLSALIAHLEAHRQTPHLSRSLVIYRGIQCQSAWASGVEESFVNLVVRSMKDNKWLRVLERNVFESDVQGYLKSLVVTTQAVDLIEGGVKMNVLPERASAVINHRIATDRCAARLSDVSPVCLIWLNF